MPKLGMKPLRRASLVQATIAEIGRAQSLDVTVGQIAKTAGVSTALAHHYFGGKNEIFLAAMRHILSEYGAQVRSSLALATTPYERAAAIITASFDETCFAPATVSAWMTLYSAAPSQSPLNRLLLLYQTRLRSNLTHALRPLSDAPQADAEMLAALIDGLYLRATSYEHGSSAEAKQTALRALEMIVKDRI
ncbi:transcriptional regulator BetI [Sulfitobacter donghicola]|uniref:HTH-type transcriptional regulator BetI n=1 Tax=Sulfitobacter donghicola DSW-25 = KCTC 12864 = JCM 14565 TaxID=1300350 RepID=A0A073IJZ2_9RHOB|nr:transcriptional regulator BetI [Sulfitobacter donghicola]KEJ89905.1 BetI family transcriptional regulator [Sulfitobacter donghicola DSW-25 = KCTC 12864 = JCM 14565]KIN66970.1 HTH-type transcriptional regulator BetI [Sulfitobacter donghicola DSW-25 = KCTC 12864 = JCM 14565]